jgi:hypothetical protein
MLLIDSGEMCVFIRNEGVLRFIIVLGVLTYFNVAQLSSTALELFTALFLHTSMHASIGLVHLFPLFSSYKYSSSDSDPASFAGRPPL